MWDSQGIPCAARPIWLLVFPLSILLEGHSAAPLSLFALAHCCCVCLVCWIHCVPSWEGVDFLTVGFFSFYVVMLIISVNCHNEGLPGKVGCEKSPNYVGVFPYASYHFAGIYRDISWQRCICICYAPIHSNHTLACIFTSFFNIS